MRIPAFASPIRSPIQHDVTRVDVDLHDPVLHERDPVLSLTPDDDDVARGCRAKVVDSTQHVALSAARLESFDIAPVELTGLRRRHFAARNADFGTDDQPGVLGGLDACKLRERALSG